MVQSVQSVLASPHELLNSLQHPTCCGRFDRCGRLGSIGGDRVFVRVVVGASGRGGARERQGLERTPGNTGATGTEGPTMDLPRKMGVSQPETMDFPERKLGNAGVLPISHSLSLLKPVVEVGIPLLRGELPWSCCTIPGIPGIPGGFARPFLK